MQPTSTNDSSPTTLPTRAEQLEQIRQRATTTAKDFDREDVLFLLSLVDQQKANLLAATDRVVELEAECKKLDDFNTFTVEVAQDEIGKLKADQERREADVRALVAAVDDWLTVSNGSVPLKVELAAIREAVAKVREWLKEE